VEHTPFYAESGGQEADHGIITTETGTFFVDDVQKVLGGNVIVHYGKVISGVIKEGQEASLQVDAERRKAMQRAHTATHLLHAALRHVLGDHVRQGGSKVGPDWFRFDFSHFESMSPAQIQEVERLVNEQVLENKEVNIFFTSLDEAKKMGAMALFGEKYGETVRVVQVPDWSMELCGGTHAKRTGDIGLFHIISESASSQGIRRIEAITGKKALEHMWNLEKLVKDVAEELDTSKDMVVQKLQKLNQDLKEKDKEIKHLVERVHTAEGKELFTKAEEINGVKFINAVFPPRDPGSLIIAVDAMRSFNKPFVAALGTLNDEKPVLVLAASPDVAEKVNLREVVNIAASYIGGKGGGRPTLVQAGGTDASRLSVAVQQAIYECKRRLGLA
jgi:alanyl-tRNA synthetase